MVLKRSHKISVDVASKREEKNKLSVEALAWCTIDNY